MPGIETKARRRRFPLSLRRVLELLFERDATTARFGPIQKRDIAAKGEAVFLQRSSHGRIVVMGVDANRYHAVLDRLTACEVEELRDDALASAIRCHSATMDGGIRAVREPCAFERIIDSFRFVAVAEHTGYAVLIDSNIGRSSGDIRFPNAPIRVTTLPLVEAGCGHGRLRLIGDGENIVKVLFGCWDDAHIASLGSVSFKTEKFIVQERVRSAVPV